LILQNPSTAGQPSPLILSPAAIFLWHDRSQTLYSSASLKSLLGSALQADNNFERRNFIMSGHEHHHEEDPAVCIKVGIFFICVMAALFLIALL